MTGLRIVSLLPSATELVDALGLSHSLVGRSHECDYPPQVESLPICTQPRFDVQAYLPSPTQGESPLPPNSGGIHAQVTDLLQSALSVYALHTDLLEDLRPTHIITQAQCEVCAVSLTEVEAAVAQGLSSQPQIISLQPNSLSDLWQDVERVGTLLHVDYQPVLTQLQARVDRIRTTTAQWSESLRPRVVCIEWTEPMMTAGNWMPELVHWAGGINQLSQIGQHSPWIQWSDLLAVDPDVLIFMPCGYTLEQTHLDALSLTGRPEWPSLKAVRTDRVYVTDGNHYFNRPGPRLVDSLEILAEILHPDVFLPQYSPLAWIRLP